jgi:uncharacterized protein (UPF0212 family)
MKLDLERIAAERTAEQLEAERLAHHGQSVGRKLCPSCNTPLWTGYVIVSEGGVKMHRRCVPGWKPKGAYERKRRQ